MGSYNNLDEEVNENEYNIDQEEDFYLSPFSNYCGQVICWSIKIKKSKTPKTTENNYFYQEYCLFALLKDTKKNFYKKNYFCLLFYLLRYFYLENNLNRTFSSIFFIY